MVKNLFMRATSWSVPGADGEVGVVGGWLLVAGLLAGGASVDAGRLAVGAASAGLAAGVEPAGGSVADAGVSAARGVPMLSHGLDSVDRAELRGSGFILAIRAAASASKRSYAELEPGVAESG